MWYIVAPASRRSRSTTAAIVMCASTSRVARARDHRAVRRGGDGGGDGNALQPAALGGDQHGLGAVDGTELAVDVVQVRAHRARGERELVGDLLVDLALGEPLQDAELAC